MVIKMNETTNKTEKKLPTQMMLIVRVLVGVYLYYTVYSLISGGGIAAAEGGNKIFFVLATILFVVAGAFLIVKSAKDLLAGNYEGGKLDPKKDMEEEADEIEWRGSLEVSDVETKSTEGTKSTEE